MVFGLSLNQPQHKLKLAEVKISGYLSGIDTLAPASLYCSIYLDAGTELCNGCLLQPKSFLKHPSNTLISWNSSHTNVIF